MKRKKLSAGARNTWVRLESRTDAIDDAMAMEKPTWKLIAETWASISLRGRVYEDVHAAVIMPSRHYDVVITHRTDVDEKCRVVVLANPAKPQYLNIISLDDPDGTRRDLALVCEFGKVDG
jgi:head-tail adaptor